MGAVDRRGFLRGLGASAAGAGAVGVLAAGCAAESPARDQAAAGPASAPSPESVPSPPSPEFVPFHGEHQTGITTRAPAAGLMAALTVVAPDRAGLQDLFRDLTEEIDQLMSGRPYEERPDGYPPLHTGHLGNPAPPADLSVVVSVGASLFDERFGLADRRPKELIEMPYFPNDKLDPARSHGDLLLTISSDSADVSLFALRQIMRRTRSSLVLHWMLDGFNRRDDPQPGKAEVRNLMGFRDGTANLHADDPAAMAEHVWVGAGDGEPPWAVGGSYHVVRQIRMFVEFWDRTRLVEQEDIFGRRKASGAPFNGTLETDLPDYTDDAEGAVTPLNAHIRLANPRTDETRSSLILRRGFSFSRGFDGAGRLDQGLAFVSFQRSLEKGFVAVQKRLDGEPLEEYLQPQGGGYYFALPGAPAPGTSLGDNLLA